MRSHALLVAAGALSLAACAAGPAPDVATPLPVLPDSYLFAPDAEADTALATLMPTGDAAFDALGTEGTTLLKDEQRPVLVAVLRDHLLPGHLTPEAIGEAIDRKGGPVTMATLGQAEVTFSKSGETVNVVMDDGSDAAFAGTAIAANNGVVIPINKVLLPPKG